MRPSLPNFCCSGARRAAGMPIASVWQIGPSSAVPLSDIYERNHQANTDSNQHSSYCDAGKGNTGYSHAAYRVFRCVCGDIYNRFALVQDEGGEVMTLFCLAIGLGFVVYGNQQYEILGLGLAGGSVLAICGSILLNAARAKAERAVG